MTPERWNIIKELFLEAQELPREQRREFLDARCAQDEPLRHEVEDLLSQTSFELPESSPASSDMTGSLSPAPDFPAWTDVAPPEPEIPKTIGPYQITRALGEGGMGVVYLAERFDPIRQTVAIKLIRPGLDSRAVLSRFQAERRTLAMMNHPNIARVLDAGITADRRPYFVMEYVPGEPITRFCDRHQLSTRARLELFVQACAAVAHAHQKAVLHRDLKPSNLLVTMQDDKPLLKVIDFGVAKATGESRQGQETFFTEHGMLVGTPAYMSPEQADPATSADVDTRSDVYSLGVVLYELLAGALPFEPSALKAAAVAEMLRVIREEEPPRPSNRLKTMDGARGTEVARLRHVARAALESELRRELEWIPLKAMRKEAGQRYRSAGELADDIGHYLAGTPLIAGPESVGYRVRKLLRRNRAKVATAAAFLLLLVAAVIVSTVGFVRASRHAAEIARQKSEVERSRAVAITERDTARAVTDFLTADVLAGAGPATIGDARVSDAIVRAMIRPAADAVGRRFAGRPLVEAAVRHTLAVTFLAIGQGALALPQAEAALGTRRKLLGDDHPDTLQSQNVYAIALQVTGGAAAAEPMFKDALERTRRAMGPDHADAISALGNYAGALELLGRDADAAALRKEAFERCSRTLGVDHPDTISATSNYAAALVQLDRPGDAEPLLARVLDFRQRTLGEEHPDTLGAINGYASALDALGRPADAEPLFKAVLDRRRRVLGADHPDTLTSINNYAAVLARAGRDDEAEPLFKAALDGRRRVFGVDHPQSLASLHNYAEALDALGRPEEAEPLYKDVLERRRRVLGPDHPATLSSLNNYALVLESLDRAGDAEPLLRSAMESNERVRGVDHPNTVTALANYANVLVLLGRLDEARTFYGTALERAASSPALGPKHADTIRYAGELAKLLDLLTRDKEAAAIRLKFNLPGERSF